MTKKEILEKLKKTYKLTTDRIFNENCHIFNDHDFTNPRSQGCPRFQSGEELANSVGKINAC